MVSQLYDFVKNLEKQYSQTITGAIYKKQCRVIYSDIRYEPAYPDFITGIAVIGVNNDVRVGFLIVYPGAEVHEFIALFLECG